MINKNIISQEIPFTSEAIKLYKEEAKKRMRYLEPAIKEYKQLERRVALCDKKLL